MYVLFWTEPKNGRILIQNQFSLKNFVRYRLSCRTKTHLPTFYQHDTSTFHHGVSFKTVKNGGTEMIYYSLCQTLQTRRL